MRSLVPIKEVRFFLGNKSTVATYNLIHRDPDFAKLFFRLGSRTVIHTDELLAYIEARRAKPLFVPPEPKRGRPAKQSQVAAE